jgi:hypothetical protein
MATGQVGSPISPYKSLFAPILGWLCPPHVGLCYKTLGVQDHQESPVGVECFAFS